MSSPGFSSSWGRRGYKWGTTRKNNHGNFGQKLHKLLVNLPTLKIEHNLLGDS